MAERIAIVSAERVRDELMQAAARRRTRASGLRCWSRPGWPTHVLPELPALALEIDEHHRHKDVYEHTLTVLEQAIDLEPRADQRPDLVLRLAALLHDVGKPKTRRFEDGGGVSFHHHEVVGARLARKRLTALRYPKDVIDDVVAAGRAAPALPRLRQRRVDRRGGPPLRPRRRAPAGAAAQADPGRLHDAQPAQGRRAGAGRTTTLEERIARLREQEELAAIRPDLDGNAIMAILGIRPGRDVGAAYRFLLSCASTAARSTRTTPRPSCAPGGLPVPLAEPAADRWSSSSYKWSRQARPPT